LGFSRWQQQSWNHFKRIVPTGRELNFDNCRLFAEPGGGAYRWHASVVIELATHMRKPAIARKASERLKKHGKLADKALAHWKPDAATPATSPAEGKGHRERDTEPTTPPENPNPPKSTGGRPRKWWRLDEIFQELYAADPKLIDDHEDVLNRHSKKWGSVQGRSKDCPKPTIDDVRYQKANWLRRRACKTTV
jgi:hypothetical protein